MSDSNAGKTEKLAKVVGRMSFELKKPKHLTHTVLNVKKVMR